MKNNFLSSAKAAALFACFFASTFTLNAQGDPGTNDDTFILRVLSPSSIAQDLGYSYTDCGWFGSTYGPSITEELCGEVVWAFPDSLGCSPLPAGSLTGKIAFIRRGTCSFSLKVYHAQQAGAKAVIIANHYTNPMDQPCAAYANATQFLGGMTGLDSANAVTIPSVFIQRQTAEAFAGALSAGQAINVCFTFPSVLSPYAAYHYATPASQATTLSNIGLNVINREATTISNMVIKADIHEPGGNVFTIESNVPPIGPGVDTLVFFPPYTPPPVVGEFEVVISNNLYTTTGDTLRRKFVHTDYTWALDNLTLRLDGGADRNDLFAPTLKYQIGALIFTGANDAIAKYATFGIANIDSVYDASKPDGNFITVVLYAADSDGNGNLNLLGDFEADLASDIVATYEYEMTGLEQEGVLIDAPLLDFNSPTDTGVTLLANSAYYITVLYNGEINGSGRNCAFSNTAYEDYLAFGNEANAAVPSVPMVIGGSFSYWGDRTVVTRLHTEGYTPVVNTNQPPLLDVSKYSVTPNPASDNVRLNLDLAKQSSKVYISIFSLTGQTVRTKTLSDFQSGQINFDVRDVPSGTYLMRVFTDEGRALAKVSIKR